ncbi:hypothetical protein [Arsenophonus nasoniae]|uniref:hypothetical protein n=1 Tax=Arsenophonus nasoniae TaxID=638 RepID=UPI0038796FFE
MRWVLNPSTHKVIMIIQFITVRTMAIMMPNGLSTAHLLVQAIGSTALVTFVVM